MRQETENTYRKYKLSARTVLQKVWLIVLSCGHFISTSFRQKDKQHRQLSRRQEKGEEQTGHHCVCVERLRNVRDEVWRAAKLAPICREKGMRFAEELSKRDRDAGGSCGHKSMRRDAGGKSILSPGCCCH